MASLRDEVIGRIEKLEVMMATILELLQGCSPNTLNPKLIPKNNEPRVMQSSTTKTKEKSKTEPPGEEFIPMHPFRVEDSDSKASKKRKGGKECEKT